MNWLVCLRLGAKSFFRLVLGRGEGVIGEGAETSAAREGFPSSRCAVCGRVCESRTVVDLATVSPPGPAATVLIRRTSLVQPLSG